MKHDLSKLFDLCLSAEYTHTEEGGDFCFRREGRTLYLFFECSDGAEDWKNNLDFPAVPYRETEEKWYCHRGFLRVFKGIEPYIEKTVKSTIANEVVVVGYSHGAALAVLAHEYIWYHRPDLRGNLWGYGFGCPRCIWTPLFGKSLSSRWAHFCPIRNIDDPVTHLPPSFLLYRHANKVYEIGEKGKYKGVDAHRPENYRTELEKDRKEKN